jgi:hypothetical protein
MRLSAMALGVSAILVSQPLGAQVGRIDDPLLDRLVGAWVMEGTIAGDRVTHDVSARWILGHEYLEWREVSRAVDSVGAPAYEALVLFGHDTASKRHVVLWLDNTGSEGIASGVLGYGTPQGDSIPYHWELPDGSKIHNTFAYDREADAWRMSIDGEANGDRRPFARVTLTRPDP